MRDLHPSLVHHIVNVLGWPALRPLQESAIGPVLDGSDALLLAPTAGGKTEAAVFPLLSAMASANWTGLSVLYVCPLKALLNNLLPRLETYAAWTGRRAALWHGDTTQPRRRRILADPPDILLTTPESLESMLVSVKVEHRAFFRGLRAVVVDEVHAFAGDDRGWHLLAVLERLTRVAGRPVQRVGLSATVGNPADLLTWLQGSGAARRPGKVIAPEPGPASAPAVELDHVGSVENAAKVISALHRGEKRLVFCDSRRIVEQLGAALRALGVTTFLSHASLSLDERRRAEHAFAEARDCVIVATSTLELGLDVGDLDRVVQVNSPGSVASFLQRLGRTGRRPGTSRNCLLLALGHEDVLSTAALLLQWSRGFVEPVAPPPEPRHIVAQQLLALCLQEHQVGERLWPEWWDGLPPFGASAAPIVRHLVEQGYLDSDGGMLFIGPEAEKRFGRIHFRDLTAVFTAAPQFTVLNGRTEVGRTDPMLLTERVVGPRLLLLGGHSWRVTWIDWKRRRCFVEPADGGGRAGWIGAGTGLVSFELARAARDVLLGDDPPVAFTRRARAALVRARDDLGFTVHPGGSVISRSRSGDLRWWTWAGDRANATLKATLSGLADPVQRISGTYVRLREDLRPESWRTAIGELADHLVLPEVDERAMHGLKFSTALPRHLARATLAARLADLDHAAQALAEPHRFTTLT
ncbi:DEAD/DEAH box helicase [Actinomadura rubrisoli]|uniref:DEAD/DEAH box helicase n=1 Tax=Actinomadura rubrisoli TaxID=2530368 RepID=A0A4R5A3I4_9ACTN|nr:DEAD/DEAH box helicase [Actinomadura rubrisoli]TDD66413.1 DEAD/DEAH box helicase [Actinomadura rubrisoli]